MPGFSATTIEAFVLGSPQAASAKLLQTDGPTYLGLCPDPLCATSPPCSALASDQDIPRWQRVAGLQLAVLPRTCCLCPCYVSSELPQSKDPTGPKSRTQASHTQRKFNNN